MKRKKIITLFILAMLCISIESYSKRGGGRSRSSSKSSRSSRSKSSSRSSSSSRSYGSSSYSSGTSSRSALGSSNNSRSNRGYSISSLEKSKYTSSFSGSTNSMVQKLNQSPNSYKNSKLGSSSNSVLHGSKDSELLKEELLVRLMKLSNTDCRFFIENYNDSAVIEFFDELQKEEITNDKLSNNIEKVSFYVNIKNFDGSLEEIMELLKTIPDFYKYTKDYINYSGYTYISSNNITDIKLFDLLAFAKGPGYNAFDFFMIHRDNVKISNFLSRIKKYDIKDETFRKNLDLVIRKSKQADYGGSLEDIVGQLNNWEEVYKYEETYLNFDSPQTKPYNPSITNEELILILLDVKEVNNRSYGSSKDYSAEYLLRNIEEENIKNFLNKLRTLEIKHKQLKICLDRINLYEQAIKFDGTLEEMIKKIEVYPEAYQYSSYFEKELKKGFRLLFSVTDEELLVELGKNRYIDNNFFIENRWHPTVRRFMNKINQLDIEDKQLNSNIRTIKYKMNKIKKRNNFFYFVFVIVAIYNYSKIKLFFNKINVKITKKKKSTFKDSPKLKNEYKKECKEKRKRIHKYPNNYNFQKNKKQIKNYNRR